MTSATWKVAASSSDAERLGIESCGTQPPNGALPADRALAMRASRPFELINLESANALGLTIPQSLLLRTEQVVE